MRLLWKPRRAPLRARSSAYSLEFGAWSSTLGVWSLQLGVWSLALGVCHAMGKGGYPWAVLGVMS